MKRRLHRERGTAAIEMTVVLFISLILLALIVLFGRLTWHATALTKSTANTSRVIATLPHLSLADPVIVDTTVVREVRAATVSAGLDLPPVSRGIQVLCGATFCYDNVFDAVTVVAIIPFRDTIFDGDLLPFDFVDPILESITINSTFEQAYVPPKIPLAN